MKLEDAAWDAWGRDVGSTYESKKKTEFIKACRLAGAYARRVEDQYAVGPLDMIVAFPGMPVAFLEGKVVEYRAFRPTDRQWIEGDRIAKLGEHAVPLLVAWDRDGKFYIHLWTKQAFIDTAFSGDCGSDATTLYNYLARGVKHGIFFRGAR